MSYKLKWPSIGKRFPTPALNRPKQSPFCAQTKPKLIFQQLFVMVLEGMDK